MSEEPPPRKRAHTSPEISVEPLRYDAGDLVGEKVRLVELLGTGGMGAVWRARHLALDVDVAVKLLHGELISPEATERLQREAHAAARLEHPSAVRVFDFGRTELGDSYIVMELLRGESLADHLERRGPLSPADAVRLLLPVAGALAAAHARGIVHRDLKPDNIMLVDIDGLTVPKLVDFGIATIDGPPEGAGHGAVYGSPEYMSPEHARGDDAAIDARSDVWSLGVVLYETMAGRRPFEHGDPLEVLRAIERETPPTLERGGHADARLSAIVARALEKSPSARWPDMRAFGRALSRWALDEGIDADVTGGAIASHWGHASRLPPPAEDALPLRDLLALRDAREGRPLPARRSSRAPRIVVAVVGAVVLAGGAVAATLAVRGGAATSPPRDRSAAGVDVGAPDASDAVPLPSAAASHPAGPPPASAAPPAAPATSASLREGPAPVDTPRCVVALFPDDAFEPETSFLGLCAERDVARGAQTLRTEIARHGLVANRTTEAMRAWAGLHWYELPTFAFAQARCCPAKAGGALETTSPPPGCDALGGVLDELQRAVRESGDVEASVLRFRAVIACHEAAVRRNETAGVPFVRYGSASDAGAENAFLKIVQRSRARR